MTAGQRVEGPDEGEDGGQLLLAHLQQPLDLAVALVLEQVEVRERVEGPGVRIGMAAHLHLEALAYVLDARADRLEALHQFHRGGEELALGLGLHQGLGRLLVEAVVVEVAHQQLGHPAQLRVDRLQGELPQQVLLQALGLVGNALEEGAARLARLLGGLAGVALVGAVVEQVGTVAVAARRRWRDSSDTTVRSSSTVRAGFFSSSSSMVAFSSCSGRAIRRTACTSWGVILSFWTWRSSGRWVCTWLNGADSPMAFVNASPDPTAPNGRGGRGEVTACLARRGGTR